MQPGKACPLLKTMNGRKKHKSKRSLIAFLCLLLFWGPVQAGEISFTFENQDVSAILKETSKLIGVTFLFDPEQVKGKLTILSPKKVSAKAALELLRSALALHGYALVGEGNLFRIFPLEEAPALAEEKIEVLTLSYARAEEVAYALAYGAPYGVTLLPYFPTNSLVISGSPEAVARVVEVIRGKPQKPKEQGE